MKEADTTLAGLTAIQTPQDSRTPAITSALTCVGRTTKDLNYLSPSDPKRPGFGEVGTASVKPGPHGAGFGGSGVSRAAAPRGALARPGRHSPTQEQPYQRCWKRNRPESHRFIEKKERRKKKEKKKRNSQRNRTQTYKRKKKEKNASKEKRRQVHWETGTKNIKERREVH